MEKKYWFISLSKNSLTSFEISECIPKRMSKICNILHSIIIRLTICHITKSTQAYFGYTNLDQSFFPSKFLKKCIIGLRTCDSKLPCCLLEEISKAACICVVFCIHLVSNIVKAASPRTRCILNFPADYRFYFFTPAEKESLLTSTNIFLARRCQRSSQSMQFEGRAIWRRLVPPATAAFDFKSESPD